MKKLPSKLIMLIVAAVAIGAGAIYWLETRGTESTDDASIEATIIPIAPKVTGYIVELDVRDNQLVKKGDVILKVDPHDYQIALAQAQADLASAEAHLEMAEHGNASIQVQVPSNLASAKSRVESAQAEWDNAVKTLKRLQGLDVRARSQQSVDDAVAAELSARSNLNDAQAKLRTAETAPDTLAAAAAQIKELEAAALKARAGVDLAQNNLDHTTIYAARDGRITHKNVEVGSYVQPGQQTMTLIGNDTWVVANFKETQLDGMKPGQKVDIHVDAYPGTKFKGTVDSMQAGTGARLSLFPPENATGNFVKVVQRVPVKITFDQPPGDQYPVGPGMSVVPTVYIQ